MIAEDVAAALQARARPETKEWWERYMKGALPFRGVKMADIRAVVHEIGIDSLDDALAQFAEPYSEDKLAGVLALSERIMPRLSAADVPRMAEPFAHIGDWSTCDWYCVKVLGKLIEQDPAAARPVAAWRDAQSLWQRRAAAVAFVNLVPGADDAMTRLVLRVLESNVRDPARFSQTGVAWVLRELAKAQPEAVDDFIARHRERMSKEALRQSKRVKSAKSSAARSTLSG